MSYSIEPDMLSAWFNNIKNEFSEASTSWNGEITKKAKACKALALTIPVG